MRLALRTFGSVLLGVLLLIPLAWFYGFASLPVYHSWGLAHGSFATALPALVAASFVSLGLIPWFGPVTDPAPRIVAALSVLPLVTILFWVNQSSSYAMFSWSRAAVYAGVFCLLAILCNRSRVPAIVPLLLLIPLVIESLFGLLYVGMAGLTAIRSVTRNLLFNILPVLLASGAALALTRYVQQRKA
jgi:hypothetical protein